ncbi:MAG: lipoate--protein ligase family protein [Cyanobacteria bacterium J007]|jgi:lipoate-protein ligase A|nr:MAG: lipoate--protein ligase family protein [Cyanobacteria bacterium J007]
MSFPTWRLIPPIAANGRLQMAVDCWLLQEHRAGRQPPSLRFYTWTPAAISLGYHQRRWPRRWQELTWQGEPIALIRRPTGGRAVLHQGDLTYAVVTSEGCGNLTAATRGDRRATYEAISQFLVEGWARLGVPLNYGQERSPDRSTPNCFDTATVADLVRPDGVKAIGSAQLRQRHSILQHGSIPIDPSPQLCERIFGSSGRGSGMRRYLEAIAPDSTTLDPRQLWLERAIAVLVEAAEQCFRVRLVRQPLTEAEWEQIARLGPPPLNPEKPALRLS